MASIVEKYELILKADPKSRIFVELARALLEKGGAARAVEICARGLEYHPNSILGRVTWGRALLELSRPKEAMDQFEIAIALEPANPYAFNLVGEALIQKGQFKESIPVLARAVELQPADHRVQGMLDEAMRKHRESSPPPPSSPATPARGTPAAFPELPEPEPDEERTEPYRVIDEARAAPAVPSPEAPPPAVTSPATSPSGEPPAEDEELVSAADLEPVQEVTGAEGRPLAPPPTPPPPRKGVAAQPPAAPPPIKPPPPRKPSALDHLPGGSAEKPRSALDHLPGGPGKAHKKAGPRTLMVARVEADKAAEQYEHELRSQAQKAAEAEEPKGWRKNKAAILGVALGLVATAGGGVFWFVRDRQAATDALHAGDRARAGIARDTRAALSNALDLLTAARKRRGSDPVIASLAAQTAALLAVDHEDPKAKALLAGLAEDEAAGEGALAARWALAASKEDRKAAEERILAVGPSSPPMLQAIAGRILLERGEFDSGRGRLEIAAHSSPPLLRALVDLGDVSFLTGDVDGALICYTQAMVAHPTHPVAVAGAAEARLATGQELERSRKEIAAVDADAGSQPPVGARLRYEIAAARVLAALGEGPAAAERLKKAAESLGKSPRLSFALADVHLSNSAWDRAEVEAKRVVELAPKDPDGRVLLARARVGKRDFAGALAVTEKVDTRSAHLVRAIARFERGEIEAAREELEKTLRDGRLTAEAAAWFALTELALRRIDRADALLEKLTSAPSPPAIAFIALGRVRMAEGKPEEAEKAWRAAVGRDPRSAEAQGSIGRHLLATGRAAEAVEPLSRAVAIDGSRHADRIALAEARIASGEPSRARADLDLVVATRPRDPDALRALAEAWIAEKSWGEARKAAERAAAAAPRDPRPLLLGARAVLQVGERGEAKKLCDRALRLGPTGAVADEARKLLAEATGKTK